MQQNKLNNRIKWLDTAKGITIILVAFGHLELGIALPIIMFVAYIASKYSPWLLRLDEKTDI